MLITIINPKNNSPLNIVDGKLTDNEGNTFPVINGIPRIADIENYTDNFGVQWNKFDTTQLDRERDGLTHSNKRLFAESGWCADDLTSKNILEVGSGAGRFSKVVLECTKANLYSVDYSDAVSANYKNNGQIAPERFHLFQASIYELPFPDNSFDKVFCFGVLQHTPDFQLSIKALVDKAKPGSEIVVDFYAIKGWWTKIHAKYILRPITKKLSHKSLMTIIQKNINWMMWLFDVLQLSGFGVLTRFIPIADMRLFPKNLTITERKEWAVLDTFDMFSPEYDNPQRIIDVVKMFEKYGADVNYYGIIEYDEGSGAGVRAIKKN